MAPSCEHTWTPSATFAGRRRMAMPFCAPNWYRPYSSTCGKACRCSTPPTPPRQQRQWVKCRCRGVFSHYRRLRKRTYLPLDDNIPADDYEANLRETFEELTEGLSPREREVLDLIRKGYKVSEIATRLGIKPRSVSQTQQRIIQRMKSNYRRLYL